MLMLGIILILLGVYNIIGDGYDLVSSIKTASLTKKETTHNNNYQSFKLIISLFFILVGIFSILNYVLFR